MQQVGQLRGTSQTKGNLHCLLHVLLATRKRAWHAKHSAQCTEYPTA